MEDMAADFGWDLFDEEEGFSTPLTSEEVEAERRSQEQEARDSMIGEMYNAQYCFDWFDKSRETWSALWITLWITIVKITQKIPRKFVKDHN